MGYLHTSWHYGHCAARAALCIGPSLLGAAVGRRDIAQKMMHRWCKGTVRGLGIDFSVHGAEILDAVPQAVFVANHLSQLDILVVGAALNRDYRWLAKSAVFNFPILGWHLRASGHVPVYRGEQRHRNSDIGERIRRVVDVEKASLLFFPEGTRSRDGELRPFRIGAFMSAVHNELPVVPMVLRGTHDMMAGQTMMLDPNVDYRASVTFLPPIAPQPGADDKTRARALRARTFAAFMRDLYPDAEILPGQEAAEQDEAAGRRSGL